jgi:hypothetical protein
LKGLILNAIVLFFKTAPLIDPSTFVLSFCKDFADNPGRKQAHAVQRLTPMTLIGKATTKEIDKLAETVLTPHFHVEGQESKKVSCDHLDVFPTTHLNWTQTSITIHPTSNGVAECRAFG